MAEARLIVRSVGPMVSFQDAGRAAMLRYGVCASGPMDRFAFACANAALDKPLNSAAIEVSLGGLTLECVSGEVSVALAGAEPVVKYNDATLSPWCVTSLRAGDQLLIRGGSWGSFSYLAFAGSLRCAQWLGSVATHSLSGLGGGLLQCGDEIQIASAMVDPQREGALPIPECARPSSLMQVVTGPQDAHFTSESIRAFLSEPYTLSPAYDRMGVKLEGPHLAMGDALSIPSEPIVRGSVQVSGDGSATVLLADHQTTGGYPKIATVVSTDTDQLVQLRSGQCVRFASISPSDAVARTRVIVARQAKYLESIKEPRGTLEYRLMHNNLIDGVVLGSDD